MQENDAKKEAADFLKGLRKHLGARLPLQTVEQWICGKGKAAKEELFVEELVLKEIPEYLKLNLLSPTDEQVRKAFLTESRKARVQGLASMSPASAKKYKRPKAVRIGRSASLIRWCSRRSYFAVAE